MSPAYHLANRGVSHRQKLPTDCRAFIDREQILASAGQKCSPALNGPMRVPAAIR